MNKNTKSILRTKKPQATKAKVTKAKATKAKATKAKVTKTQATKTKVTKTQATKRRASTAMAASDKKQVVKRRASTATAASDKKQVVKRRASTAMATKVKETPDARNESHKSDDKILDDEITRLKREEYLEKLRQYYQANRETICKNQNSKYPDRKERVKNNPELIAKHRRASKKYYHQNKDKILPKIKRRYVNEDL